MKRSKKNIQSAIEYLTTYAWAILLIAVIFVVVWKFSIFRTVATGPRAQPGSCTVQRNPYSQPTLYGVCGNLPPQYIATFTNSAGQQGGGQACVNTTIQSLYTQHGSYTTINVWLDWNGTVNETPVGFPGYFAWFSTPNDCIGFSTGNKDDFGVPATPYAHQWTMFTFEFYSGSATSSLLYINGQPQNPSQCQGTVHTGTLKNVVLIVSSTGSKYRYTGGISNVQVYNTTLSPQTIQAMYLEGVGGEPLNLANLTAWFPLNSNSNDYSGNSQNLYFASCNYGYLGSYTPPP